MNRHCQTPVLHEHRDPGANDRNLAQRQLVRHDDEAEQQQLAALRKQQELAAEQSRLAEENRKEAEAEQLRFVALREQQELAAEQARQADIQRLKDEAEAGQQRMTALRKKEISELKKNRAILIALGIFCAIFLFGMLAIIVKPGEPEPSAGSDEATAGNAAAATAVEAAKEAAATPRTDTDKAIDILDKVIKANK